MTIWYQAGFQSLPFLTNQKIWSFCWWGWGVVRKFLLPHVNAKWGCRAQSEDPLFSIYIYIFFSCVRRSVGSSSSRWTAAVPTVLLGWRFCPVDTRRENNVIMTSVMTLSPRRVPVGLACEAGQSTWCSEFVGVTASSAVRSMLMSLWLRELQEAELVDKVPPVYVVSLVYGLPLWW